jgi:hypothetical protein
VVSFDAIVVGSAIEMDGRLPRRKLYYERFSSDPAVRWMLDTIFEVASSLPQTQ